MVLLIDTNIILDYLLKREPFLLTVAGTTHEEVIAALDNAKFKDFEDCILTKCAKTVNADYIVTRNKPDFMFSEITAVSPEELIGLF